MIKKVLEQVERDLDAFVDHAADSQIIINSKPYGHTQMFNSGALEAYKQAAIRSAEIVYTYYKPSSCVLVFNELEMFVNSMIEYRMQEKLNEKH